MNIFSQVRGGQKNENFLTGPGWSFFHRSGVVKKMNIFHRSRVAKKMNIFSQVRGGQKDENFFTGPGWSKK
jgi:hypothetical protein